MHCWSTLLSSHTFLFCLHNTTFGNNLQVVNGRKQGGRNKQNEIKETISLEEVIPLEKRMETGGYNGHTEGDQEGVQKILLGLRGVKTGITCTDGLTVTAFL